MIGPLHIQRDIPCQDACAYEILSSGWGIIAVADGLGSAPKSDIGAKSVVDAAVKTGKAAITAKKKDEINYGEILREIVFSARKTLEARAIEEKCNLRELACTIIVVLTYEDTIAVAHVGDGAVVAKINNGLKLISEPEESEYVNEVVPLTSKEWEKSLRISAKVSDVECVAVFTDGCQRAALLRTQNGLQPYDRFFEPLFTYAQELDNLYLFSWEKIPGNDDGRLIEFLIQNFSIEWIKAAKINKNDDGKTIRVTNDTNFILLTLNNKKTNVNLEIDDGRTDKFIVKMENGELNIYDNLNYGKQDIHDLLSSQKMSENSEDDKTLVISVLRERYNVND